MSWWHSTGVIKAMGHSALAADHKLKPKIIAVAHLVSSMVRKRFQ